MRYISHLDLMRLFARAVRRAGLPVKISEGFSPHPKISMPRALKLGIESAQEQVTMGFTHRIDPRQAAQLLNGVVAEGIRFQPASAIVASP
jgi:radical SAM-linked protein